jgi:tetratricopeptide (TPR) repeat protein
MNFLRKGSHSVWKLSALLAASLALISQISVEAAGKTVKKVAGKSPDAMTLYAQKNFLAASQAFYKKVTANPSDAESYYYMGNCAVALKNFPQALQYYKRAADLSPDSPTGLSSKQATDRVTELMKPPTPASDSKAKVANDAKDDDATDNDKEKEKGKKDPRLVAAEAQGDAKIAAAEKAAKRILDDATAQCKPIKDDEDRDASEASANRPNLAGTETGNQIVNDIRAPYEERIKNIMEPAKKRAQALKDTAKKEADAIKQAVSLSKK